MQLTKSKPTIKRLISLLSLSTALLGAAAFVPLLLRAGTGGVQGGCAYAVNNGKTTQYKACTGANLPMWYSADNPTYNQGDFPCGQYGNQNCGMELGDPLNE